MGDRDDTVRPVGSMSHRASERIETHEEHSRSGFVSIVGRPNVGKSTLINQILGEKVSITSSTPNTTRTSVRGVLNGEGFQVVFVDTPGIHKPRSPLGTRLNATATDSFGDVDLCVLVIDATAKIG